jgi:hypothetical protein
VSSADLCCWCNGLCVKAKSLHPQIDKGPTVSFFFRPTLFKKACGRILARRSPRSGESRRRAARLGLRAVFRPALKYETISRQLKVYLTRILSEKISDPDNSEMSLIRKNRIVNMSRNIQEEKIFVLECDDSVRARRKEGSDREDNPLH